MVHTTKATNIHSFATEARMLVVNQPRYSGFCRSNLQTRQVHEAEQPIVNWEHEDDESTPPMQVSLELLAVLLGSETYAAEFVVEDDLPVTGKMKSSQDMRNQGLRNRAHIINTSIWYSRQEILRKNIYLFMYNFDMVCIAWIVKSVSI